MPFLVVIVCAILGANAGTNVNALRITKKRIRRSRTLRISKRKRGHGSVNLMGRYLMRTQFIAITMIYTRNCPIFRVKTGPVRFGKVYGTMVLIRTKNAANEMLRKKIH